MKRISQRCRLVDLHRFLEYLLGIETSRATLNLGQSFPFLEYLLGIETPVPAQLRQETFDKAGDYTITFELINLDDNEAVIAEGSETIIVK